jgi:hypothetical protein
MKLVGFLILVVSVPDKLIPLDIIFIAIIKGILEVGLQREPEFPF